MRILTITYALAFYRSKTPRLIRSCCALRKSKTRFSVRPRKLANKIVLEIKQIFRARLRLARNLKLRQRKSISKKETKLMLSSNAWSVKTERWPVFRILRCSRLKQTWSSLWMKSVHSSRDNRRWSPMRTKWSVNTPSNSSNASIKFKLQRMMLRQPVMPSSSVLKKKKWPAVPNLSSVRTCATSFTYKRMSLLPVNVSQMHNIRRINQRESYKKLRISKCV